MVEDESNFIRARACEEGRGYAPFPLFFSSSLSFLRFLASCLLPLLFSLSLFHERLMLEEIDSFLRDLDSYSPHIHPIPLHTHLFSFLRVVLIVCVLR